MISQSGSNKTGALVRALDALVAVDQVAGSQAIEHLDRLTKPKNSLGQIEDIAVKLSRIAGAFPPQLPNKPALAIFAGDHGVVDQGVTPWPSEVTAQMVANFLSGGAAANVFARQMGAEVVVIDVGVSSSIPDAPGLIRSRIRPGTANLALECAMLKQEAVDALDVGAEVAFDLAHKGFNCLLTGDMGIGNTTPSAALISALSAHSPQQVTGRGTGIDDDHLLRKISAIQLAISRTEVMYGGHLPEDPIDLLASIGGLEIAAIAGYIVAGASCRLPVLVDGVIALAGALIAKAIAPDCAQYMFAGHLSTEPGAAIALDLLGIEPILDLQMRLGEGTGACLAVPIIQASCRILHEMATFDSAGVTPK